MRKKIPKGLYKKLAALSVIIAFSFGLVISIFQIYHDYSQQESRLVAEIDERISLVQGSAEKAVYEFDEALAKLVVDSIAGHPAILKLTLYDDYNDAFKSKSVRNVSKRPKWWPAFLLLNTKTLSYPLSVSSELSNQSARIDVEVDPFLVVNDLVERSLLIIVSGLIRNVLLAIVLLFLSYRLVTRAILGLNSDLSKIDPLSGEDRLIEVPEKHKKNELGSLANLINNLLIKIRQVVGQSNELNAELNQQLLDKSHIEEALNLAGERTAGQTGKEYIKSMVEFIGESLNLDGVALYRRKTQGDDIYYQPIFSMIHGREVVPQAIALEDLPLDIVSGHHAVSTITFDTGYTDNGFQKLYGMTIPIRNPRQNIVNLLQLVSTSPISDDFYAQHKSLLQILSRRFVTESERERQERLMLEVAHTDNLTKLSNRNHFQELLKQAIDDVDSTQGKVILLHVDVNNFKWVNESYGYEVGDELLIQMARRLKSLVTDSCKVARVGGDEFVIIMSSKKAGPDRILSQNIHAATQQTFAIRNHLINPKVSIGVVMYPDNGDSSGVLIKNAEYAVNMAKHKEGVKTQYFTDEVAAEIERKVVMSKLLSNAIDYSLLSLNFQPIFNVSKNSIQSVEVLCRWNNPELGDVSPDVFIAVAEESGLIHKLGSWVLSETLHCMKTWQTLAPELNEIKVAINFSAHQLNNPTLVEQYLNEIKNSSIEAEKITFEITESMLIDDLEQASLTLNDIANLGCDISIDDFGTGYSSLQYLKHLPIKNLKIDKGFIKDIPNDDSDMSIVEAIVSLAKAMNMSVIAEGIETKEQVKILADLGCDMMQGFYFSKPLTNDQLISKLTQN